MVGPTNHNAFQEIVGSIVATCVSLTLLITGVAQKVPLGWSELHEGSAGESSWLDWGDKTLAAP